MHHRFLRPKPLRRLWYNWQQRRKQTCIVWLHIRYGQHPVLELTNSHLFRLTLLAILQVSKIILPFNFRLAKGIEYLILKYVLSLYLNTRLHKRFRCTNSVRSSTAMAVGGSATVWTTFHEYLNIPFHKKYFCKLSRNAISCSIKAL